MQAKGRSPASARADPVELARCRSALLHHAATVPVLAARAHPNGEPHLLIYFDRHDHGHPLLFDAFVDWYDERHRAVVLAWDRCVAVEPEHDAPVREQAEVVVEQARPDELDEAAAIVREQLPRLAWAAFDIDASALDRAYLDPSYAAAGVARGRRVFVVRERGQLVGVALCEAGEDGHDRLGLGELRNLAQLYLRRGASAGAVRALVGFVRAHYRTLGSRELAPGLAEPLLVVVAGTLADPAAAGLRCVETLASMIVAGSGLRAYRSFLGRALAELAEREDPDPVGAPDPALPAPGFDARPIELEVGLDREPRLHRLLTGGEGPIGLLGFLLHAAALHVRLGERSDTLRRAGSRCAARGEPELGDSLARAAAEQLTQEQRWLDDLFELGERWDEELGLRIHVELLLRQPPPRSLLRLLEITDQLAAGPEPAAVLAIEAGIAGALAELAPALLRSAAVMFGGDLRPTSLEAAARHASATERLCGPLQGRPALARAARPGVEAYLELLGDCVELGRELADRAALSGGLSPAVGLDASAQTGQPVPA